MSGRCFFPRWEKRNLVNLRKTKEKKKVEASPVSLPVVFTLALSLTARRAQPVLFQGGTSKSLLLEVCWFLLF